MVWFALSRLRRDCARSVFLVSTLLLSVLSFLVLGASAKTSQVKTTGTVLGAPAAYDLIVRPPASVTAQERTTRLVRANYLSGVYGGITHEQWHTIQKSAGVQTAAPIAMIGQVFERAFVPVDLTAYVDKKTTTVLRFTSTDHSRGGTASTPGPNGYLMVGPKVAMKQDASIVQQIGDRQVKWCPELDYGDYSFHGPLAPDNQLNMTCTDVAAGEPDLPTRSNIVHWPHGTGHYVAYVPVTIPVTIAAIDPASEHAMVGLDTAITKGKNLTGQNVIDDELHNRSAIPVLSASHLDVADDLTVDVSRLDAPSVTKLQTGDLTPRQSIDLVRTAPAHHVTTTTITAAQAHTTWLNEANADRKALGHTALALIRPAGVTYTGSATTGLRATAASVPQDAWRNQTYSDAAWVNLPPAIAASTYRTATVIAAVPSDDSISHTVSFNVVGQFDPAKVAKSSGLSGLPMPPYETPTATAADATTRALIPGGTLKPDNNPLGYLQQAPTLLTSLDALPELLSARAFQLPANVDAPISAIRVKVTGGQDGTKQAAARVKLVAQRIHDATGLEVQVTKGSSPKPVTVTLPATVKGDKDITITEQWTKLDVATAIVAALDRKTLVLLVLVLVSSALAVAISAHAAVRARRVELGVLACIGWRRGTLIRSVLAEFFLIGLAAGVIGSLAALLVAHLSDITIPTWWILAAVPATVVMTLAAATMPAIRAGRSTPIAVVHDAPTTARRPIRVTGIATMAFSSAQRTPGRVLAAAASLAMGVASLALIYGITQAFRGAVVGTVMGDVVAVQVKTTDLLAALVLALVGLVSLGNVLFLDMREQAAHYASLRATGWTDRSLASLITWQAVVIGIVGSLAGAAIALAGLAAMSALTTTTVLTTLLIAALGVGAAALVSFIPAGGLRRIPTARLLAGE